MASSVVIMKPNNSVLGDQQLTQFFILSNIFDNSDYSYNKSKYCRYIRPVTENGQPTRAAITFKNFLPIEFNFSDGSLTFVVDIVKEYVDPRLQYDPLGLKHVEPRADWENKVWGPCIRAINRTVTSVGTERNGIENCSLNRTLIGPNGDVYSRQKVKFTVKSDNYADVKETDGIVEFSIELKEDKENINNVLLNWSEKGPVTFSENSVKTEANDIETTFEIQAETDVGLKTEEFGIFGEEIYSMLKLKLRMSKIKTVNRKAVLTPTAS